MTKAMAIKMVGVILILAFTCNTALASTARYNLRSLPKINHTNKKSTSKNVTMNDPTVNDDYRIVFHSVKHCTKRLYNPVSAITTSPSMFVALNCIILDPINISNLSSNNLFSIFIPPR
jgi:hypothetical protein